MIKMLKTLAHISTFTAEINVSKPPKEESSSLHKIFTSVQDQKAINEHHLGSEWLTFLAMIN